MMAWSLKSLPEVFMFKKSIGRWIGALSLSIAAQAAWAAPVWQFNPAGSGPGDATSLSSLAVGGVGFVQIIPDANNPTTFTFLEQGAYQALQADGVTPFGSRDLTITYSVMGTGSFLNPTALQFSSGNISLFSDGVFDFASTAGNYGADNGAALARFKVVGGGLDSSGLVSVNAAMVTGSLLPGYLFAADGSDLATYSSVLMNLGVFNQPTNPDSLLVSEIVCGLSTYPGPGCDGTPFANSPLAFVVRDGGFVSVSAVPEPDVLGLSAAGLGLLLVASRRRRPLLPART